MRLAAAGQAKGTAKGEAKGVANAVLAAMSRYPTHSAVLAAGAETLQPLTSSVDVEDVVKALRPCIAKVAADDQRVAAGASSLLGKLANLTMVEGIMSSVDVEDLGQLLLQALTAGEALTDKDVKGLYMGACVAAMGRLAGVPGLLSADALPAIVGAVVAALKGALARGGNEEAEQAVNVGRI